MLRLRVLKPRLCNPILVLLLSSFIGFSSVIAAEIHAVSSKFAPLQMQKNGKLDGYTITIIHELLNRMTARELIQGFTIDLLPWKRAMRAAKLEENTVFFSISRTESREKEYQWISEISPYEINLYKLKDTPLPTITSLEEAKTKNVMLSAPIGSSIADLYQETGLVIEKNFIEYNHYNNGIPMLFGKRFDAIPLTSFVAKTNACAIGYDGDQLVKYFPLKKLSKPLWVVASLKTSPNLVQTMRKIMNDLHQEGFIKETQDMYINQWINMPCEVKE
ncbi:substrate-binding periplasmic protein [Curvivirga aplysinae]|uniref:substrate-binding periplasmic protein n=1 Tax=Curvivirga aplysinae TaxID=2529852 RepID=UPI0012BB560C|nr:transporter substrate-binding domain-containing protein [Curvivirga aplysinae]